MASTVVYLSSRGSEEEVKEPPLPGRLRRGCKGQHLSQCLQGEKCEMREGILGGELQIAVSKYLLNKYVKFEFFIL